MTLRSVLLFLPPPRSSVSYSSPFPFHTFYLIFSSTSLFLFFTVFKMFFVFFPFIFMPSFFVLIALFFFFFNTFVVFFPSFSTKYCVLMADLASFSVSLLYYAIPQTTGITEGSRKRTVRRRVQGSVFLPATQKGSEAVLLVEATPSDPHCLKATSSHGAGENRAAIEYERIVRDKMAAFAHVQAYVQTRVCKLSSVLLRIWVSLCTCAVSAWSKSCGCVKAPAEIVRSPKSIFQSSFSSVGQDPVRGLCDGAERTDQKVSLLLGMDRFQQPAAVQWQQGLVTNSRHNDARKTGDLVKFWGTATMESFVNHLFLFW